MKKAFLLFIWLGYGLICKANAMESYSEKDSQSPSDTVIANAAEVSYKAISNCSKEEMIRFIKACPGNVQRFIVNLAIASPRAILMLSPNRALRTNGHEMRRNISFAIKGNCPNIVRFFIYRGADVNQVDGEHEAPIYTAVNNGCIEITGMLINRGVDINRSISPEGLLPLHCAVIKNDPDMVKFLLFYGANVNAKITGDISMGIKSSNCTALHLSMFNADQIETIDIVRVLLENGANVTTQNSRGNTPLHVLLTNGKMIEKTTRHEITKMLLANEEVKIKLLTLRNNNGKTALDLAKELEDSELVDLLGCSELYAEEELGGLELSDLTKESN